MRSKPRASNCQLAKWSINPVTVSHELFLNIQSDNNKEGPDMTGRRIVAILVGIGIMAPLNYWGLQWYFALALGVLGYAAVLYIAYFMRERRYIKNVMAAAKRDQNSR